MTSPDSPPAPRTARLWRLLTLQSVEGLSELATERAVIGLSVLSLGLWLLLDRWSAGPGLQFDGLGIPALALSVLLALTVAFAMARFSRPPAPFRTTLFVLLAPLPLLILAGVLIDLYATSRGLVVGVLLLSLYAIVYLWFSLRCASGAAQPRAVLAVLVLVGAYLLLAQRVDVSPTLWAAADTGADNDQSISAELAESLLYDQRDRIDEALDRVEPGNGAGHRVFFVGFAGVASERVFAEEIKLAADVVAQRFDSGARELLLINDQRDLDSFPIASVSGLREALSGIAHKMDPERDILFLALSSHGSEEPTLAVENGGLPLAQLSPEELAAAFHDAGIRWRIVVISACYAGGFIDILRDPSSIVITAAAANKSSFGCSNDRDLTYFGEAFYRDALPLAHSLQDAFATATAAIGRREREEQDTPSDPQAYFGADLARLLTQLPMRAPLRQARGTVMGVSGARAPGARSGRPPLPTRG